MVLLLLVGCGQLAFLNAPPEVRVLSPDAGALVSYTGEVQLVVEVSDDYDPLEDLDVQWTLADGAALSGELSLDEEASTVTLLTQGQLPRGEPTLTVRVVDHLGESDAAELQLLVFDDQAPTITWQGPIDGGRYPAGWNLPVAVQITDPDPLTDTRMQLSWSGSAVQGVDDLPTELAASGLVEFELEALAIAHWTLGLSVVDALGATGESSIGFDVANGDRDNDGYIDEALGGDDCDDTSGGVHPDAAESCNDRDDDCDTLTDEDATDAPTWFGDGDGDGFGDAADPYVGCTRPAGRVADATDCDDSDATINPDGVERCNHADDDCDGAEDEDAYDLQTVWTDFDGDGYGAGDARVVCFPESDDVANADDCDDGESGVYPGAPELCDAANTDEDCDGTAEDDDPDSTGKTDVWGDADGDNRGNPGRPDSRCDLGSDWADNADDCDDTVAWAWTGRAEVCEDGLDYDCDGRDANCRPAGSADLALADVTLDGDAYAGLGIAFAALGDVDGDGLGDFAVSALLASEVYLVRGAGLADGLAGDHPTLRATGSGTALGEALANLGDVDGDGVADLLVGAPDTDTGAGAAWIFSGAIAADADTGSAWAGTTGASGQLLGSAVAGPGDFDGDGWEKELLLGAAGRVVVTDASFAALGDWTAETSSSGATLALAADVDGDGLADALYGDPDANTVYLVVGGHSGSLELSLDADVVFDGVSTGDEAGAAVAGLGDVNGDGFGDLAVGAPGADVGGASAGEAYVVFGGVALVDTGLDRADARLAGLGAGDEAGHALAGLGDVDGDGLAELLVGGLYEDSGGTNAGAAWLIYGSATLGSMDLGGAGADFVGESAGDNAGEAVGAVGDIDGDGFADLGIGAPSAGSDGRAYIVLGGGL